MSAFGDLAAGALFAGDYRVVRKLSEGGMGAVYVAEQQSTTKRRALKVMLPSLVQDPKLRERFEREARVGAQISSEHVVEVVGAGVDAATGMPWLAMELLEGEDLATVSARRGPLPASEVREIMRQLCHGVAAAHAAGVVHRDLKPENVFLAKSRRAGADFTVKILDFGIARIAAEAKTSRTDTIGSPFWLAPEQAESGHAITPATDVWAIALITFKLLTGTTFWLCAKDPEPSAMKVLKEMFLDAMPAASVRATALGVGGLLPRGFDGWFHHATQRNPTHRYPDARAAFATLEGVLEVDTAPMHSAASHYAPPTPSAVGDTVRVEPLAGSFGPPLAASAVRATTPPRSKGPVIAGLALAACGLAGTALILLGGQSSTSKKLSSKHADEAEEQPDRRAKSSAAAKPSGGAFARKPDPTSAPSSIPEPPLSATAAASSSSSSDEKPVLGSCEAARLSYMASSPSAKDDLTAGAFSSNLNNGRYLDKCHVPSTTGVTICAAIREGRAVGVTVKTSPSDPTAETCVRDEVMKMTFPSSPKMDIATTTFAPAAPKK